MIQRLRFTLIELLVVIAIIAILASMLLPALSRARYQTKVIVCIGTVKNIIQAMVVYADDYDGFYMETAPPWTGTSWQILDADGNKKNAPRTRIWQMKVNGYSSLHPLYQEYLGGSLTQLMMCPLQTPYIERQNLNTFKTGAYMLYPCSNYSGKHFSFEEPGGFTKVGTTFKPYQKPDVEFSILASDVAQGDHNYGHARGLLSGHRAFEGFIDTYDSEENNIAGWGLGQTTDYTAPLNFGVDDGSVHTYRANGMSHYDTNTWVTVGGRGSSNFKSLLPRELEQ